MKTILNTASQIVFAMAVMTLTGFAQQGDEAGAPENAPKIVSKPFLVPDGADADHLKDAARSAAEKTWKEFIGAQVGAPALKRFAILPLQRDISGEYVALQLRNQFTEICGPQGLELYTRVDTEWDTLLNEIAWGENFGDTMDAATVQKFGRVKGVEALVFARILGVAKTDTDGVKVRLNVQVFEIETGRQLWGREIITEASGELVPLTSSGLVQDIKNHRQWIIWGGVALVALIVLIFLMKSIGKASRPR